MKLFTFRSPAVQPLWDIFSGSLPHSFELHPIDIPQEFDGVLWEEPRYWSLMKWIVQQRVQCVAENMGEVIATSGCDSVFFGDCVPDLMARLERCDYVAANDIPLEDQPRLCSCLQALRCTKENLALQTLICSLSGHGSDDTILNQHRDMVRWEALPRALYWNLGGPRVGDGGKPVTWKDGMPIPVRPREALWFHANWTIGTGNKLALLRGMAR